MVKLGIYLLLALIGAPLIGGLLTGIDRRLTARLQSRIGPPILQPFYDVMKLFGKSRMACNSIQMVSVSMYLATMALSVAMLVMGQDLLVLLFISALGAISLVIGGFSVKSPYSQIGSQREVMAILAYEPLVVFYIVAVYLKTGSFMASSIFQSHTPLLMSLPLFLVTVTIVLAVKTHKSPFDVAAATHAHQELVRGFYTEFSGAQLALIEIGHWFELVLILGFLVLLWHTNLLVGCLIALACYFGVIVLDNISARLTWSWMLRFTWAFGVTLSVLNIAALYVSLPHLPAP